jgi:hypothetical protein
MYKVYWFDYRGNWAIVAGSSEEDAVRACYEDFDGPTEETEQGIKDFLAFRERKTKQTMCAVEVVSLLKGVSSEKRGCLVWLP